MEKAVGMVGPMVSKLEIKAFATDLEDDAWRWLGAKRKACCVGTDRGADDPGSMRHGARPELGCGHDPGSGGSSACTLATRR